MKMMRILFCATLLFVATLPQNLKAQSRNLFARVEIATDNVYTFLIDEMLAITLNEFIHYPLLEGTLSMGVADSEYGNLDTFQGFHDLNSPYWNSDSNNNDDDDNDDFTKCDAEHLLGHINAGAKLGFLSDINGPFNYCLFGAAYYNLHQFKKMENKFDYERLNTQRLQLGGGLMAIFGRPESDNRYIFEAGARYNIPTYYKGPDDLTCNDALNTGISSHYMFKYSYKGGVSVGMSFDMMHYDLFKDESIAGNKSRVYNFGIVLSALIDAFKK